MIEELKKENALLKEQFKTAQNVEQKTIVQTKISENETAFNAVSVAEQAAQARTEGKFDEAIALYSKAIQVSPQRAELYYYRGGSYRRNNEYANALKDYNKAMQLNPQYAEAYLNRGALYIVLREDEKGIADELKSVHKRRYRWDEPVEYQA